MKTTDRTYISPRVSIIALGAREQVMQSLSGAETRSDIVVGDARDEAPIRQTAAKRSRVWDDPDEEE